MEHRSLADNRSQCLRLHSAADNVIVSTDDDLSEEIHVMKIDVEATVSGNTVNLVDEIYIRVESLRHT